MYPGNHIKKIETKDIKGILVGYTISTKGYRIWLPESNKINQIIETINVKFNEKATLPKGAYNKNE